MRLLVACALLTCGCHADSTHAAPAPEGEVSGPGGGPGGGGDGGTDARDSGRDATVDVEDAGSGPAKIVGTARTSSGLVSPVGVGIVRSSVKLTALKLGGGTAQATTGLDGAFVLDEVDASLSPAWVSIVETGRPKTLAGVAVRKGATTTLDVPVFALDAVAAGTALVGLPPADTTKALATVVLRVVDSASSSVVGAKAGKAGGAAGPFYDDGKDLGPTGASTGKQGAIVYLQVPVLGGGLPIVVTLGTKEVSLTAALEADAVTWMTVVIAP